jgi:hypothetical protein
MGNTTRMKETRLVCGLLITLSLPVPAAAELLGRIEVKQESGVGVIHIILTRPVVLTSYFPPNQSYLLHIYFNDVASSAGAQSSAPRGSGHSMSSQPVDEYMRSPPTDLVPDFWVTFQSHGPNDSALDPSHLMIQFKHEVKYKVQQDRDNRGFYIFVFDGNRPSTEDSTPSKKSPGPAANPTDDSPAKSDPN